MRTNETEPLIRVHLAYKGRDGGVEPVGEFVLDLPSLARRGLVTRRGNVFDVKLSKAGGRYWLGVRTEDRAALSEFGGPGSRPGR